MHEREVIIPTPNGNADAYFVHHDGGKHPAVLVWPDISGLRRTFRQMGRRLAESGYAVLVVNQFYRARKAFAERPDLDNPEIRKVLFALKDSLTPTTMKTDAQAFIAWLDAQPAVDTSRKMATTGYCMGGAIAFETAAVSPSRVGALATFHGADLVTDKPSSPHLLIPKMKAHTLIAIAENDDAKEPHAKDVLRESFAKSHLPAEIEVYKGALHGWCPPDGKVHDPEQAERVWSRMLALFKNTLI